MATKRALICSYYIPQPDLDSACRGLLQFVQFLQSAGWHVSVAAKNWAGVDRSGRALRQRGVPIFSVDSGEMQQLLSDQRFDVAILKYWHIAEPLMNIIRDASPSTRIIVDSGDIHFLRHARRIFNSSLPDRAQTALDGDYASDMIREMNVYATADAVVTVSQKEADLLNELVGDATLARAIPDSEDLRVSPVRFEDRRGVVLIGNFEHPPNVDAVRFLCHSIVPHLDPGLLAEHPLYVIGRDLEVYVPEARNPPVGVKMVGWVPSVIPYLERVRISIVPLLYGAGTKRKVIQTLTLGTPAVVTTVGAEGLDLRHGEHVLIADEPLAFARAMTKLITDRRLWRRLGKNGRSHLSSLHTPDMTRTRLFETLEWVLSNPPKTSTVGTRGREQRRRLPRNEYQVLVRKIRRVVRQALPESSTVAVVSRGDSDVVALSGRRGWHFPQTESGEYAGFHPSDSASAMSHLEDVRVKGADFLLFPSTAFWWLDHYADFRRYLEDRFSVVVESDSCLIFDLRNPKSEAPLPLETGTPAGAITSVRPSDASGIDDAGSNGRSMPSPVPHADVISASRSQTRRAAIVIPTRNRAALLGVALESLVNQTVPADDFEVVVVDDGSTDATGEVSLSFSPRLQLKYCRTEPSGIAAAKNTGILATDAPIILFFDDDDVADRRMLAEHLAAHEEDPEDGVSVLGYTAWAPWLHITEVMHFAAHVGHYIFSYDHLKDGQTLDFTYFWGGRTSCKRSFLESHGLFRPEFHFGCEDIELGYRLSKLGLRVVYRANAMQYMNRPMTYQDFCARCERQGRAQWTFSRMHDDPVVQEYCQVQDAEEKWALLEPEMQGNVGRVAELERVLADEPHRRNEIVSELHRLYWWSFDAFKIKGLVEAMRTTTPLRSAP